MTHNYLLQLTLSLFVTGPCFVDSFFAASTSEIIDSLQISHEQFSLLISVPALTGIVSAVTAVLVALYGSTLSAMISATLSFLGAVIVAVGLSHGNYATVMIGRIVFVLFWSLLASFQTVIIFRQFRGAALAWVFSLQIFAIRLGTASGLYFAGPIIDMSNGSVDSAFRTAVFLSGFSLLSTFVFAYLYRGSRVARLVRPLLSGRRRQLESGVSSIAIVNESMPRDAKILCLVIFLYYGGLSPFESFGVDYLSNQVGIPRDMAGGMMSTVVMFSFFSPIVASFLTTVKRQLTCVIAAQGLIGVSMLATVFGLVAHPMVTLSFIGVGHLICVNGLWLALAGVSPSESAKTKAASFGSALNSVSTSLTSWSTGKIRDVNGDYTVAFAMLALSILAAMCATIAVHVNRKSEDIPSPRFQMDILLVPNSIPDPITEILLPSPTTPIIDDYFSKGASS